MTLIDYLRGLTNYPVPEEALQSILSTRVDGDPEFDPTEAPMLLATADLYRWLSTAPDVTQGGQSYNLTDATRAYYRARANALYRAAGEPESITTGHARYGYKGDRL